MSGPTRPRARLKLQTQLRDGICAFPFCFRPAEAVRLRTPRPATTPTGTTADRPARCNLAPCCRRHHRAKTTGGWTYITVEPGVYLWRSPLGYQFLKDHTGTLDVTPDAERRRLAREFRTHFGGTDTRTLTTPPHTPLSATASGDEGMSAPEGQAELGAPVPDPGGSAVGRVLRGIRSSAVPGRLRTRRAVGMKAACVERGTRGPRPGHRDAGADTALKRGSQQTGRISTRAQSDL